MRFTSKPLLLLALLGPSCVSKPSSSSPVPVPVPLPVPAAASAAAPSQAAAPSPREATGRTFINSHPSDRALAQAALDALRLRDRAALHALRITEREYKEVLFPELDAAKPGRNLKPDFQWEFLDVSSRSGMQDVLDRHGGEDLELLEVVPAGGVEEYTTFRLLRRPLLKVRRRSDGQVADIRAFGHVVVLDGQYKILGFPS